MPELPEVETMRRGVLSIVGATISGVHRPRCKLRAITVTPGLSTFRRRAVSEKVKQVDRLGKRLLVWLSNDYAIVFEPRMTGLVLLADPPSHEHLRLRLDLKGSRKSPPHLWYWDRRGLGSVCLMSRKEVNEHLGSPRLGPDALSLDAAGLKERLGHRRRPIKVALLDQSSLAGIGNLYASEILHVARIDPRSTCQQLSRSDWRRLAASMQEVLQEAIRYEGSTLADGTYRTALNVAGGYQNRHRVYDRAGESCASCGQQKIVRIVQAQRSTFYCPQCQETSGKGRR